LRPRYEFNILDETLPFKPHPNAVVDIRPAIVLAIHQAPGLSIVHILGNGQAAMWQFPPEKPREYRVGSAATKPG